MWSMSGNSPSQNVPVEILGEIFGQVVGSVRLHRNKDLLANSLWWHNPWELALVCKNWRDAAFLTPFIWRDISLDIVPSTSHKHDALLFALKLCLERSRTYSLDIGLIDLSEGNQSDYSPVLLRAVMEHAPRWRSASIGTPLPSTYLSNYPVQYTRLLRIEFGDNFQSDDGSVGLFQDAPLLSNVAFCAYSKRFQSFTSAGIPWSQITRLTIYHKYGQLEDLINILNCTPNLEVLSYRELTNYYDDDRDWPTLELPHLQQIYWETDWERESDVSSDPEPTGPAILPFFELLKAPQLTKLEIEGLCGDEDLEAIRDCLQRSLCSIKHLYLPTLRIFPILGQIPDIKTLALVNATQNVYQDDEDDFDDGNFEFVHLENIYCAEVHFRPNDACQLFEQLQAPQLSELRCSGDCILDIVETIHEFFRRSKCSVKTLCITDPNLFLLRDVTFDVETLILSPNTLEHLMPIIHQLTCNHSSDLWLFPKLKRIELNVDITAGPESEAFARMLEFRLRSPPDSLTQLECEKIRELELGYLVRKPMKRWFRERLQEHMVITWEGPSD